MDDARIAELLAPFLSDRTEGRRHEGVADAAVLSPAQLQCILMYIDLLLRWNARINLTAVRRPQEIVTRHFGESIFAARHLFPREEPGTAPAAPGSGLPAARPHVVDIGSGAGFPGLPIKIWAPEVDLTLIESSQKKATFLREAVRTLKLTGVEVFTGRADGFTGQKGYVVTLRAVEHFESIIPVAAGLAAAGGRLAVLIGEAQLKQIRELVPGFNWDVPVRLPLSSNRVLIIGSKES
jgi:16S rRNA (guanine527-N7)-methyltransferase